jgi:hypothetical protein
MKTFLAPLEAGWKKVTERFTVNVVPLRLIDEAVALSARWLFCTVPPCEKLTGFCHAAPASFERQSKPEGR